MVYNPSPLKLKILFLALSYPDVSSHSSIYTELIHALASFGVDVLVVAPAYGKHFNGLVNEAGISVLRVNSKSLFSDNLFKKGIRNIALPFKYFFCLRKYLFSWRPDWILVPTPPITLAPLVWCLKRIYNVKSYLILRDIFPQNALDLRLLSKFSPTYYFFRLLEKLTYSNSELIGCMSSANISYITAHNRVDPNRLRLFANWIDIKHTKSTLDRSVLRSNLGVKNNEMLCIFGGNLGKPQKVDFLLDICSLLRYETRIRFVVVGRGTQLSGMRYKANSLSISNISFHSFLSRTEYQQFLIAADLGLILLNNNFSIPNIPSRLNGYWAAGVPVLAATDHATDLYDSFLKPFNGGKWVPMCDQSAFIKELLWFVENPSLRRDMGENGRQAVLSHFTAQKSAQLLIDQMQFFS